MTGKLLLILTFTLGCLSSCKRCIECSYDFGGLTYSSGEVCGNKKEVEDLKLVWENNAKAVGGTANCSESK